MMSTDADAREAGGVDPLLRNGSASAVDSPETESSQAAGEAQPEVLEVRDAAVGTLTAERAEIGDALVGALVAEHLEARDSLILLAVADRIEGEGVKVLLSPKSAVLLGAALGLVFALMGRLFGRRG